MSIDKVGDAHVSLIDIFRLPREEADGFLSAIEPISKILRALPGHLEGRVYLQEGDDEEATIITTALWDSPLSLGKARSTIGALLTSAKISPQELMKRHRVSLTRGIYREAVGSSGTS